VIRSIDLPRPEPGAPAVSFSGGKEMPAFIIGIPKLSGADPSLVGSYFAQIEATLVPYGGRFRATPDHRIEVLEGHWRPPEGLADMEFPSFERAQAWYHSAAYAPRIALWDAANLQADAILVDGPAEGETLFVRNGMSSTAPVMAGGD
jgi:uncharacterized protein (DUF1330 family)